MNFVVGQEVIDKSYVIDNIVFSINNSIDIWIKKDGELRKWKTFLSSVPISIEYNINF